jgi:hypothetical protein
MKKFISPVFIFALICSARLMSQDAAATGDALMPSHLYQDVDQYRNIVYSPSFRVAWTMLCDNVLRAPVSLQTRVEIAEELNLYPCRQTDYSDRWITEAGFIEKGIIEKINSETMKRYNTEAPWSEDIRNEKKGILCYSYLKLDALFNEPFEELTWSFNPMEKPYLIECFGVSKGMDPKKELIRQQLSIHDYRNPDDFIVKIIPSDPDYEIIITEMTLKENLYETLMQIDRRIEESVADSLKHEDELIIPKVSLEEGCIYSDLLNKYLLNKGFEDYFFASATHNVKFSLDHSGARAEVSGKILLKKGPVPRIYAIDNPFIIVLRKRNSAEPLVFIRVVNKSYLALCKNN